MTKEELSKIISKTQNDLENVESEEENNQPDATVETGTSNDMETETPSSNQDVEKLYDLDTYDDEEDANTTAGLDNLVLFANPKDDPYLINPDDDDDQSDIEDYNIKPNDNLLLVGHVEGNAAILEVYGKRSKFPFESTFQYGCI